MITTVLFDMGGTLEDIFVDEASEKEAMRRLREMLSSCLLYTSPSPRDRSVSRMPSSA